MRVRFSMLSLMALACVAHFGGLPEAAAATLPDEAATTSSTAVLEPSGHTALPDYSGDFDHLAADVHGNRHFVLAVAAPSSSPLPQGTLVLLVDRDGTRFVAVKAGDELKPSKPSLSSS